MTDTDLDFGSYLRTVEERDIDLILMEEFHVSPDFTTWFCQQLSIDASAFCGAWHSVSDSDGETDLLLRVRVGEFRVGVLIENKVAAPEQPDQDVRYHRRGESAREAGRVDRFVTCICAPEVYLSSLGPSSAYQHRVSYEAIRDWHAKREGARHHWRRCIFDLAIDQGRRGYVMIVSSMKSAFHHDYWEHLQRHHPSIIMREPKAKGGKSDWMILRSEDMPKGVQIVHKNDQGTVEMEFNQTRSEILRDVRKDWPEDVRIRQKGRSAALSIKVEKMDMEIGVAKQTHLIEEAMAAVYRLLPYCRILHSKE